MANVVFGVHKDRIGGIATKLRYSRHDIAFAPLDLIDLNKFDAAVPLTLDCYKQLANAGVAPAHKFIIPENDVVALCDDKLRFNTFLIENGFRDHIPALYEAPVFPYIRKPKTGDFGSGCMIVRSRRDERLLPSMTADDFLQEYVSGVREYATHILYVDNVVRYSSAFVYFMPGSGLVRGQKHMGFRRRYTTDPKHLELFTAILSLIGYRGTCCFNYKINKGKVAILELNPRYGASLTEDVTCYLDAYLNSLGKTDAAEPEPTWAHTMPAYR